MLEQLHSIKSRIYFTLQLGFCKSHHMFFVFDFLDVEEDTRYVQGQYFPDFQLGDLNINKVTRLRQRGLILQLFSYRSCDSAQRQALAAKVQQVATVSAKPIYIFREFMHYYNAMLLSNMLGYKEGVRDTQGAALLKQMSPVAWQHINLYGCYEFSKSPEIIDFNAIVQELSRAPISSTLTV